MQFLLYISQLRVIVRMARYKHAEFISCNCYFISKFGDKKPKIKTQKTYSLSKTKI